MSGVLKIDGEDAARLGDDGVWRGVGGTPPEAVASLNAAFHPAVNHDLYDHHLPPGVAVGCRAAVATGGEFVPDREPSPLPEGTVS